MFPYMHTQIDTIHIDLLMKLDHSGAYKSKSM